MSDKKADKYDIVYPVIDMLYCENTINNTTINIDKTVKKMFDEMCKEYGISKYKALNVLVHHFLTGKDHENNISMFAKNYYEKEADLARTMENITESKRKKYFNEKKRRTIRIPYHQYSETAKICRKRKRKITVEEAVVLAVADWNAKEKG